MILQTRSSIIVAILTAMACRGLCGAVSSSELRLKRQLCGDSIPSDDGCRPSGDNSTMLCSGRGVCICGVCECNKLEDPFKVISGKHCECDNFSCVHHNGLICSGSLHGECVCGKCQCHEGYVSNGCGWGDCACRLDTATCVAPGGFPDQLCSGHGECLCGNCQCDAGFSGRHCEVCPTCPGECEELKECVECEAYGLGPLYNSKAVDGQRCGNCSVAPSIVEGKLKENETLPNERLCSFYDKKECSFVFAYYYNNQGNRVVRAQKDRVCPEKTWISKAFSWIG